MAGTFDFYGHLFTREDTATTTITTDAAALWDANGSRPRKVSFTNDSAVNIAVRVTKGGAEATVKPGENALFNTISDGLWVTAASATGAYRAHAEG